ncbi:MAG TPA: alanyl-tRNA editing protein, partial [Burkholderiales bacterium]|nr:alanyl-tRNA editing protein [Burkholderiales bacterium]
MAELLYRDDPYLKHCEATIVSAQDGALELDRTVFYPMGGGQPGDRGQLRLADGRVVQIVDTRRGDAPDQVLHLLAPGEAPPAPGTPLRAELDWTRRHRHMRFHTALHLLCAV